MRLVCPGCKRVLENVPEDYGPRPFCSPKCKLNDLHGWLTGAYRISSEFESDAETVDVDHPGEPDPLGTSTKH